VDIRRNRSSQPSQTKAPLTRYYQGSKSPPRSPFVKKQPAVKSKSWFSKSLNVVLIIILVGCLIYSLILKPEPKIVATSLAYRPLGDYASAAETQLKSPKNRTKLTIDEQAITSKLKSEFPEIQAASVGLPIFGQKPVINLNIAPPSFILNSGGQRYIVDNAGVAVALAASLPDLKNLPVIDDQSGFSAQVGHQALSSSSVAFINQLVAQAKLSKVPISGITLPPLAQELDIRTSDKAYYTKFYLGGDPSIQIGQFLAARHQFSSTHQDPAEYLDVRVSGKLYYK